MTEYEIGDLMASIFSGTTSVTGLYLSVVNGYLIVAWLVGRQLTRPQVILINVFFAYLVRCSPFVGELCSRVASD